MRKDYMVQAKKSHLSLLLVAFMGLFSTVLEAPKYSSVTVDSTTPCRKLASLMAQQVDAIGYPANLACLGDKTARLAAAGLADYIKCTQDLNKKLDASESLQDPLEPQFGEAQGVWAASSPSQYYTAFKLESSNVMSDIAISGDGSLIAVAAGADGLFVYNRGMILLRHIPLAELNASSQVAGVTSVDSVSFHPTRPWLALGVAGSRVTTMNLSDTDVEQWTSDTNHLTQLSLVTAATSVRFSPDGNYLTSAAATSVITTDVTTTFAVWGGPSAQFTGVTVTAFKGHIAWHPESTEFAVVKDATLVTVAHKYFAAEDVGSGLTVPLTFTGPCGVAFNHNGKKLAVIESDTVKVVDAREILAADWDTFKENDGITEFAITFASAPSLSNVLFHPHVDILAVVDDGVGASNFDLEIFDLRNATPQKANGSNAWVVLDVGLAPEFPNDRAPFKLAGFSSNKVSTKALAWNKQGTQLIAGSDGDGGSTSPYLVMFDTHNDEPENWAEGKRLQFSSDTSTTIAAAPTTNLLASGSGIATTARVDIFDTTNACQELCAVLTAGSPIPSMQDVGALAFSPDSKYLFVGYTDGTNNRVAVVDVSNPKAPTLAASGVIVDQDQAINSLGVTKLRINNGVSAINGNEYYFVAIGTGGAGAATHQVDFRAFDGSALSTTNLADGTNLFGLHSNAAATPLRVAMRGSCLATACKDDADKPEVKVWNVQNFVNQLVTDINTAPGTSVAGSPYIKSIINADDTTLVAGTSWHADASTLISVDITSDGNAIASGDNSFVFLTSILTPSTPAHIDATPTFTPIDTKQVKFSPQAVWTTTTKDGYLGVAMNDQVSPGSFTDVDMLVYDLATSPTTAILDTPVQAYNLELENDANNGIQQFDWDRKGYRLHGAGVDGITTRHHVNTAVVAMAQAIVNYYVTTAAATLNGQPASTEVARDMARLSGLTSDLELADVDTAVALALTYLASIPGDVQGVARTLQRSFESASNATLDKFSLATIAVNRFATFNGGGSFEKAHLLHPVDLAVTCDNKLDLSRDYLECAATDIFRFIRQYHGFDLSTKFNAQATNNNELVSSGALAAQNRFFTGLSGVADLKGLDAARYAASLGFPSIKDTLNIAGQLATAAYDFVTETVLNSSALRGQAGSKSLTNSLRGLAQEHTDDELCRAAAQQAENYLRYGTSVMECMGIMPVDKAGVALDEVCDAAWAYDDSYLFVAGGESGLLIFDCNCKFITCIPAEDLGGRTETNQPTEVTSVTAHPSKPWLVVGTNDTTVRENVAALNFESLNCHDWLCTKKTLPNAAMTTSNPIQSVRFSPNGQYLATSFKIGGGNEPVKVVDVPELFANDWVTSLDFSPVTNYAGFDSGQIAWKPDSSAFVYLQTASIIEYVSNSGSVQGITPALATDATDLLADGTGLAFNSNGTKLAVTGGLTNTSTSPNAFHIINSSAVPTAVNSWKIIYSTDVTNAGTVNNPIFHPKSDMLVITDQISSQATNGGGAFQGAKDVHVFDLRSSVTSQWAEVITGKFPFVLSSTKLSDDNGIMNRKSFGLAWNKLGTKLAVGNNKLQALSDNKADLVVFSTNATSAAKWDCKRATFCFEESYRLAVGVFDALNSNTANPKLITAAETDAAAQVLEGTDQAHADEAAINAVLNADTFDVKKIVPFELARNLRAQIEAQTAPFAAALTGNNFTDVYAAAVAGAIVGGGYAALAAGSTATVAVIADMITFSDEMLVREDIGTNTGALPLGSFYALRGDRLNPNYYNAAGTFDVANEFGDSNGPGPDKDGNSGAGEWGSTTSVLHGPCCDLKTYLDALYLDITAPTTGLIEKTAAYAGLSKSEKDAIARALILRVLMSGDEQEARDAFDGTSAATFPVQAAIFVQEVMQNAYSVYTSPVQSPAITSVDYDVLDTCVKQEIAAVAMMYGDEAGVILGTDIAQINQVIRNAFEAATYIPCPTTFESKNIAIQKEMAVLGGLGAIVATKDTVGKEIARGLLSGEQIKNLADQDLGSTGQDGLSVDLSDQLLAAVVGTIALEFDTDNTGSYAAGLAYNQLFRTDSIARAVAKLTREYGDKRFGIAVLGTSGFAGSFEPVVNAAFGKENLSRARYCVARAMEAELAGLSTDVVSPDIMEPTEAAYRHILDIMRNPTQFAVKLNNAALFSSLSEPVATADAGTPFGGHPENMAKDLIASYAYPDDGGTIPAKLACDVYSFLTDPCKYSQVDGAGRHCEEMLPRCNP